MIKLDPNGNLISKNHVTPFEKKNIENPSKKILPLISIHNINTILSKESCARVDSNLFAQKIQCAENRLSATPTLNEKLHLYKTYSYYGNTPKDCQANLDALEAALLNTDINNSRHIDPLRKQLPALKLMAEALLTPDSRKTLTPSQLAGVNLHENIMRALISSASLLPDILLCTDRINDTLSIRRTLIDELIQGAQRRLTGASPSSETELRALLHAPPLSLHEKLERFIADSQTALIKPLYKELCKHIQIIKQSAAAARRFLSRTTLESSLSPPLTTDTLYAIRTVSEYLETLARRLTPCIQPDAENKKIPQKYHAWRSPSGMELAVPAAHLVHTLHRGLNKTSVALEKLHKHINHESLSPFPASDLKPFLSLSHDDRMQCLMLKKMTLPVQNNADTLQQAAADLHNAIRTALQDNGHPRFLPATPEEALRIELAALTEETPHIKLLLAAEAARTAAHQILNTSYPLPAHTPVYAKFSAVVQEYSNELEHGARLLKHAVCQTEINFRQKSILTAIHNAEKTARDIKHILRNALESVSGVALNSHFPWLRKLDIDLHTHWQGITALSGKGYNSYNLCGQGQHGMAPSARIHYAVLPLLNETEKLWGACRSLDMILSSPANQDAAEKTADNIRNHSLAGIIQAEHAMHAGLSEKNKAVYLHYTNVYYKNIYYKNGEPTPISLRNALRAQTQSLLSTGRKLQETAWLLSWNVEDAAIRQSLMHIRGRLRAIKKEIKDTVEIATGVRPHLNSPEGMIAKDAAEWLMKLKAPPDGKSQDEMITALTDRLCKEFTSQHDPEGALFRLRITLALHDAEQGTLIWPLTPQEHLSTAKTPKDYTLAWAEKRLTYSMLYNCLIHYTPAALFSLSMVKNTLVSPLRLINLLLTPVRMAVTRRAMQKVRPGNPEPTDLIAEYTVRELYQAVFRVISLLSPQLFKTVAATGITTYGLMQGGQYRHAFLSRAVSRLPGDLFWVGGFAAWHQAVNAFHSLRQQEMLSPEQVKRLQEILNLPLDRAEEAPLPQQTHSRARRSLVENMDLTHERIFKHPTKRLIEASKHWKNTSAFDWLDWKHLDWVGLKDINPVEGEIHSVGGEKYIYLRGLFWKIIPLDEDHFSIEAKNSDNDSILYQVLRVNNTWDLAKSKTTNSENKATSRLLDTSKYWDDSSAFRSIGLEDTPKWNGEIFTVSGEKYIYLRELYWKIMSFSDNNIVIITKLLGGKSIFCRATRTNGLWDLAESEMTNNQNNEVTDRLLEASKNWKDSSAFTLKALQDTPKWNGKIFTISNREYMYLRGLCWGIVRFSKHHIFIMARTLTDEPITFEVTRKNDLWDLPTPEIIQNEIKVTNRLLEKSKEWMDFSAIRWVGLKETPPWEGEIFTVSGQKYIYLRDLYWKFIPLFENTAFILAKSQDDHVITCKITYANNVWDLAESEIKNNQNKLITDFIETSPHEENTSAMIKVEKKWEPGKAKSLNHQDKVTDRLIEASKRWKNPSTLELVESQDVSAIEGRIHSIFGKRYIYLQGVPWEIFQFSEDNIFIIAENNDHNIITHEAKRINNQWDLVESEIANTQSIDVTQTQLDKNLTSIKLYYDQNELKKHDVYKTSLHWWLDTEWKNRESMIPVLSNQNFEGNMIVYGDKKYLVLYSHTWEYDYKDNTNQGILNDRFGNKINIININGKWYLNGWEQQRKHLYTTINGLSTLSEKNKIKIDDILQTIKNNAEDAQLEEVVKTTYATLSTSEKNEIKIDEILQKIYAGNPEILPEDAIQTADTALSMLLFQNIENKQYVNDILEIKYLLMLTMPGTIDQIIDIRQMEIMKQLGVAFDVEALKENLYQLYPTKIDTKNYNITLKEHYFPPQTLTFDKNDAYYKAISYCDKLISQSTHKNNRAIFNEVLFFLTKKELVLSSKDAITEEEREELYWLNIAKYHLYTTSKYFPLYDDITNHIDKTRFNTDKSILSVLNKSKTDAIKIYYLNQVNLNKKDIHLSDDDALNEYSNIVMLNNQASEYLETITAALFYQIYHSEETFTAFDFIKARLYYKQQMEQFIKEIYTFDTKAPSGFISNEDFRPSDDFSSRSDYTRQFNDYIDKGSSEYESTLLTSLVLDQFDISLENLSSPPKRWFTLKFTSYDYTSQRVGYGLYGSHYHNAKQWPEKLNVIELYNGDYITVSEINGNMKINSFKREEYLRSMKGNPKMDNYLFGGKSSEFITRIIGPLSPPKTRHSTLGGTLKFGEEKEIPDLLKKAVQQSLHSSLNVAAAYQKTALETHATTQKKLEFLVPFYKECYDYLTDSHFTINKTKFLIDFIVVCSSLENLGLNPQKLKEGASDLMKKFVEGQTSGLSRTALEDIMFRHFPKTSMPVTSTFIREAPTEIISPVSSQNLVTTMVRPKYNLLETSKFPARAQVQHNIPLKKRGEFGRYKGIYTIASEKTEQEANYFIKNGEEIYPVRWDKNEYTWRLIELERSMGQQYGMPIHYVSEDKWTYNAELLRLRDNGINTEEIIAKIEESASYFNEIKNSAKSNIEHQNKNIFTSKVLLTDPAATLELTKSLEKARNTAFSIISNAKKVLNDKSFTFRNRELIRIFTNKTDDENFLILLNRLKTALKDLNILQDIKWVDVKDSDFMAQISPYDRSTKRNKYLAINYSAYNKNKELIFTENAKVSTTVKEYYANDNLARVLIHEFTHASEIAKSNDIAGYIELLQLNGKHDVTKLLLKAKLGLSEARNNADSLTEIIMTLAKTDSNPLFLDDFLEAHQKWEIIIEKRMNELAEEVKAIVATKTQLNWDTTIISEIRKLKEEYNFEMCNQLIAEINDTNKIFLDLTLQ